MLKVRYYRLRLAMLLNDFVKLVSQVSPSSNVALISHSFNDVVMRYSSTRYLIALQILPDGSELKTSVPTMEQHSVRIFQRDESMFLSIIDAPRGARAVAELLERVLSRESFFLEPLNLSKDIIDRHIKKFDIAKLVSAKVRDFRVYENAVGRLEITSREGLNNDIAPFLQGSYYRVDSLTYEVTHQFTQGLVCYFSNGTLRVSGPLVENAFPSFEHCLV